MSLGLRGALKRGANFHTTLHKIFPGYKQAGGAYLYPFPPVYKREKLIPLITSLLSVHFHSFWLEKLLIKSKQMNVQRCVLITSIFFLKFNFNHFQMRLSLLQTCALPAGKLAVANPCQSFDRMPRMQRFCFFSRSIFFSYTDARTRLEA